MASCQRVQKDLALCSYATIYGFPLRILTVDNRAFRIRSNVRGTRWSDEPVHRRRALCRFPMYCRDPRICLFEVVRRDGRGYTHGACRATSYAKGIPIGVLGLLAPSKRSAVHRTSRSSWSRPSPTRPSSLSRTCGCSMKLQTRTDGAFGVARATDGDGGSAARLISESRRRPARRSSTRWPRSAVRLCRGRAADYVYSLRRQPAPSGRGEHGDPGPDNWDKGSVVTRCTPEAVPQRFSARRARTASRSSTLADISKADL